MTEMTMIPMLLAAALGLSGGDPSSPEGEGFDLSPFLVLRSGVWACGDFNFDSTLDGVHREIKTSALFSAGVDAGVGISKSFVLFGTYEANLADDIFCDIAGACLGYRGFAEEGAKSTIPAETLIYAGGMWGRFKVDEEGYEFDDSFGFRAGIAFSWKLNRNFMLDLVGEFRLMEWETTEAPDSGDSKIGGSGGWVGMGLKLSF
jgi:hypothetical protein